MKKLHLLMAAMGLIACAQGQNVFPTTGNVGIGTSAPDKKLQIVGDGIELDNTSFSSPNGIIYKGGSRFIFNFNYGNNGTVTTLGGNTFLGINAGNLTMGSTATSTYQGSYNTGIGAAALTSNTTGYHNTAIGYTALYHNTTGANNNAIGFESLYSNTTGNNNMAEGYAALFFNQSGSQNVAYGLESLFNNISGSNLTAIGYEALLHNTTGTDNVGIGSAALGSNNIGQYNTATGFASLNGNKNGNNNTADGLEALYHDSSGSNNVAVGGYALYNSMIASNNTAIGYDAGHFIADGSGANTGGGSSVFLGANTKSQAASDNNEVVIGYNAVGNGSNTVVLGNTSIIKTILEGNILIGETSQTNSNYKLDINGDVRANKMVVNTTGADFVFSRRFPLLSLDSLQHYIMLHHHLPDIPTANVMQQQGLSLGDAYTQILSRVEQSTLYILQLQREIHTKDGELQRYKADHQKLEALEKRLTALEDLKTTTN